MTSRAPSRRAVRAVSIATLPPPMTTHAAIRAGRRPRRASRPAGRRRRRGRRRAGRRGRPCAWRAACRSPRGRRRSHRRGELSRSSTGESTGDLDAERGDVGDVALDDLGSAGDRPGWPGAGSRRPWAPPRRS